MPGHGRASVYMDALPDVAADTTRSRPGRWLGKRGAGTGESMVSPRAVNSDWQ